MKTRNPNVDANCLKGRDILAEDTIKIQADRYRMINYGCGESGKQHWLDGANYVINILKERNLLCPTQ